MTTTHAGDRTSRTGRDLDARVLRSCAALSEAMLEMLAEGRGLDLTVSALCERAGVSRPTFYQHFGSVEGLLSTSLRLRLDQLDDAPVSGSLAAVLRGLAADRSAYGARLGDPRMVSRVYATVCEWLADRIRSLHPDADPLVVEFAAGGATRSIILWLHDDLPGLSPEELSDRLLALVQHSLRLDPAAAPRCSDI